MSSVATYLNFDGQAEEAFTLYADIFGTSITTLMRFSEAEGMPPLGDDEASKVLNAQLPILGGHVLMATDMLKSLGHEVRIGNNTTISLQLDDKEEADRLYARLSEGGSESTGMSQMFFGYWGVTLDRFGIRWMLNVA
jgi:PhnB protein